MESFSNAETMESVRSGAPLDGDTLAAMSHVAAKPSAQGIIILSKEVSTSVFHSFSE